METLPSAPYATIDQPLAAALLRDLIERFTTMEPRWLANYSNVQAVEILEWVRKGRVHFPRQNDALPVPRVQIHERRRDTKERALFVASVIGVNGKCIQETDDYQDLSAACKRANDFAEATGWPIVWTIETTHTQTYTALKQAPEVPFAPSITPMPSPTPATVPKHAPPRAKAPRMINEFRAVADGAKDD